MITLAAIMLMTAGAARLAWRESARAATWRRVGPDTAVRRASRARTVIRGLADRLLATRRERRLEASLPDALDGIARALRSGASLRQAISEAGSAATGELARDLARVSEAVGDGVPLDAALAQWAATRSLPSVRLTTAALALGAETGGASAQAVDGVAATLRMNLGIAAEVRALSSQARMSALVIVLAPVAFTALATSTDHRTAGFLLRTPFGLTCLTAGLVLDGVGWLWMRRITAVAP